MVNIYCHDATNDVKLLITVSLLLSLLYQNGMFTIMFTMIVPSTNDYSAVTHYDG